MEITVVPHSERPVPPHAVLGLYREEGWWPERTAEQLASVLERAPAAGAWAGDRLVGFARAVTDGEFRAYVEDVVVASDHRGTGAGRAVLDCLIRQLDGIPVVSLFCGQGLAGYYEAAGFSPTRQVVLHRSRK